jgi:hypothetical protein
VHTHIGEGPGGYLNERVVPEGVRWGRRAHVDQAPSRRRTVASQVMPDTRA